MKIQIFANISWQNKKDLQKKLHENYYKLPKKTMLTVFQLYRLITTSQLHNKYKQKQHNT